MKRNIKDNSIVCEGCRTRYTINYSITDKIKKSVCDDCGKHNVTEVNKVNLRKDIKNTKNQMSLNVAV